MGSQFVQEKIQLPAADAPYITISHFYNTAISSAVFSNAFNINDMAFVYAYKLISIKNIFKIFHRFSNHHFLHILFVNNGVITVCLQRYNFIYFQKVDAT